MKRWFSLLAVLGLAIGCGESTPVATPVPSPEASSAPAVTDVVVDGDSGSVELQTIALKVPSMHCPFGCWPTVQSTLAKQPNVKDVKLATQKDENAIDNPVVFISVAGDFDQAKAFSALAEAGFSDAERDASAQQ